MAKIKAAFVLSYDAADVTKWSGTNHYMTRAMQDVFDLKMVSPLPGYRENLSTRVAAVPTALKILYHRKLRRKQYEGFRDLRNLHIIARQAERRLEKLDVDVLFSSSSMTFVALRTKKPTFFWTDAAFAQMLDFYDPTSYYSAPAIKNGNDTERIALQNVTRAVYSSQWAVDCARDYYKCDPAKLRVIPYGANLDSAPTTAQTEAFLKGRSRDHLNLLFLGVLWERKGGPLALEVAKKLNDMGLKTTLHLVGLRQHPGIKFPDFVQFHGFISKRTPEGSARIKAFLANAHFLIVPSIAECFGCVFSEASAFALPSISRAVGGIPSAVRDGLNGQLFPPAASADQYAEFIASQFLDWNRYSSLARSSRHEYETRLNWHAACRHLESIVKETL